MSIVSAGLSQKLRSLFGLQSQPEMKLNRYVTPGIDVFDFIGVPRTEERSVSVTANGVYNFVNDTGKTMLVRAWNTWNTGTFTISYVGISDQVVSTPIQSPVATKLLENPLIVPPNWAISIQVTAFAVAGTAYINLFYRLVDVQ